MAGVEPATSSLPRMRSTTELHQQHELPCSLLLEKYECINKNRAENGAQTRDPQLGRLVLYRLSYFRELTTTSATVTFFFVGADGFEPPKVKTSRFTVCPIWPLWNTPNSIISKFHFFEPLVGFEPTTPRLQITCSGQLS